MTMLTSQDKQKNGFTIVEITIVIVVIGILASITTVAFGGYQQRARNIRMISLIKNYKDAIEIYAIKKGQYPPGSTGQGGTNVCLGEGFNDWDGDGVGDCFYRNARTPEDAVFNNQLKPYMDGHLPRTDIQNKISHPTFNEVVGAVYNKRDQDYVTVDGVLHKNYITYYLEGENQDCGMSDIVSINSWPNGLTFAGAKNTDSNSAHNHTLCMTMLEPF